MFAFTNLFGAQPRAQSNLLGTVPSTFPARSIAYRVVNPEQTTNRLSNIFKSVKQTVPTFFPDSIELILFIILCALTITLINLIQYTNIQQRVKNTSRCYKNRMLSSIRSNEYTIIGSTTTNVEIVRITYNFKDKKYTVEMTAPAGSVSNKISLRVYDLKTYKTENIEKSFYSIMDYELMTKDIIYIGHPELVRFMQFGNTDFFEKILFAN
jgi:hypothetical protein